MPYSTTLSAVASKVDGAVSPSAFAVLWLIESSNLKGISPGFALPGMASAASSWKWKVLQGYAIEAVIIPLSGSVTGFAGDIGAVVLTRHDVSTILQCGPSSRARTGPTRGDR